MFHNADASNRLREKTFKIATGFTTSFLGDERTLREFILGDDSRQEALNSHPDVTLILINDDFDPLTDRQLRIAVNKDALAIARHREFIGKPIAEIPDPSGCHESHASHFESLLIQRLSYLGIYPHVISTYRSYQEGRYQAAIDLVFEEYHQIKEDLSKQFHSFTLRNLYRIKCQACGRIDGTSIESVANGMVSYRCEPCGQGRKSHYKELPGKLSWKLDCAVRWNIYGIDLETFSKAHMADLGSVGISAFLSRKYFGGWVPRFRPYGHVVLSRDLSGKLMDILPPKIFKALFVTHPKKDLHINPATLIQFCTQQQVNGGADYISYIKTELPKKLLSVRSLNQEEAELVSHAQRFAQIFYNRHSAPASPSKESLQSVPLRTLKSAFEAIDWSIGKRAIAPETNLQNGRNGFDFRGELKRLGLDSNVYKFLRKLFSQENGPSIPTLLETLPLELLQESLQMVRSAMEGENGNGNGHNHYLEKRFVEAEEKF